MKESREAREEVRGAWQTSVDTSVPHGALVAPGAYEVRHLSPLVHLAELPALILPREIETYRDRERQRETERQRGSTSAFTE